MANNSGSHAPCFKKIEMREKFNGEIPHKSMRGLAASILLHAYGVMKSRTVKDQTKDDWRRDVAWLHRDGSNYELWCEIMQLDPAILRKEFPRSLLDKTQAKRRGRPPKNANKARKQK